MILPSLLTLNKRIAQERIDLAQHMSGWMHVDVLDHSLYLFESLSLEELETLEWRELMLEFHCMTNTPQSILESNLPVDRLILHYEMKNWRKAYDAFVTKGVDTWIAVSPQTKIKTLDIPDDVSGIMVMGVEPGQTGQPFLQATYDRIEQVKDYFPHVSVAVDGGVGPDNLRLLIAHGADNLVMGNAIFHTTNPIESYERYVHLSDPIGGMHEFDQKSRTESEPNS